MTPKRSTVLALVDEPALLSLAIFLDREESGVQRVLIDALQPLPTNNRGVWRRRIQARKTVARWISEVERAA